MGRGRRAARGSGAGRGHAGQQAPRSARPRGDPRRQGRVPASGRAGGQRGPRRRRAVLRARGTAAACSSRRPRWPPPGTLPNCSPRGTALADEPYAAWADPARAELRALLRRGRLTAAQAALAAGDPDAAVLHAEAATADDPFDEAACRWFMSAAAQAGEPARALLAYAALRDRLSEELGADPAPQTQELHLAILRAQSPSGGPGVRASGGPAVQGDVPRLPAPGSDMPSFPGRTNRAAGGLPAGGAMPGDATGSRSPASVPELHWAGSPGGAGSRLARAGPQRPTLAGRDAEIRVLREAWARPRRGR